MSLRTLPALLLAAGLLVSCGGSQPLTPTTPPPSSPTLISVTVSGTQAVFAGSTLQLAATANYAKGTTKDISGQATWTSASPAIATVSSAGLVTGVAAGTADIRATYQNITGSMQVTVNRQPTYTLSGTITETAPTTSTTLAGARVEILDGTSQGKFATTTSSGQYQIAGLLAGTMSVKAHLDGYDDVTKSATVNSDTMLGFALNPTARQVSETFNGQASGGDAAACSLQGGTTPFPCKVFPLAVHNTGDVTAVLAWQTTNEAIFVLQLYNADTSQVLQQAPLQPSATSTTTSLTFTATLSTPGNYQLRVVAWRIASVTSFTLITTHPN